MQARLTRRRTESLELLFTTRAARDNFAAARRRRILKRWRQLPYFARF